MKQRTIGIWGNFGWKNLGNLATLEAALAGVAKVDPTAHVLCISTNPEFVRTTYGLESVPVRWESGEGARAAPGGVVGVGVKTARRASSEAMLWSRARSIANGVDALLVAGTGIIDDYSIGPLDLPFDVFKWAQVASVCRTPMAYLSVGAGPIDHRLSRMFFRAALQRASYRSFRDQYSLDYVRSIGVNHTEDNVVPDLAFGLPVEDSWLRREPNGKLVVGLGLMAYSGSHLEPEVGERVYQEYIRKVITFTRELLAQGYTVRLLVGDTLVDQRATDDVCMALAAYRTDGRLWAVPTPTVRSLLEELARTDVVVATRYHNVLLALLLHRPVVSISYNEKNDFLMRSFGLGDLCQPIESLDVERLRGQFAQMIATAPAMRSSIRAQVAVFRGQVEKQYARVLAPC